MAIFRLDNKVSKVGGDYRFDGTVVAVFTKLSGVTRYVVEDDRGVLHIYSGTNLVLREEREVPTVCATVDHLCRTLAAIENLSTWTPLTHEDADTIREVARKAIDKARELFPTTPPG